MHVSQILTTKGNDVYSIAPDASVADLVADLHRYGVGALLVRGAAGDLVGIVSERDVVRAMASNSGAVESTVASLMTTEVVTVSYDAPVADVMRLMTERRFRHLPVLDAEGTLIGLVSIGDVVKNRIDELEAEREALVEYITQSS